MPFRCFRAAARWARIRQASTTSWPKPASILAGLPESRSPPPILGSRFVRRTLDSAVGIRSHAPGIQPAERRRRGNIRRARILVPTPAAPFLAWDPSGGSDPMKYVFNPGVDDRVGAVTLAALSGELQ